jgi:hypothetical protein
VHPDAKRNGMPEQENDDSGEISFFSSWVYLLFIFYFIFIFILLFCLFCFRVYVAFLLLSYSS